MITFTTRKWRYVFMVICLSLLASCNAYIKARVDKQTSRNPEDYKVNGDSFQITNVAVDARLAVDDDIDKYADIEWAASPKNAAYIEVVLAKDEECKNVVAALSVRSTLTELKNIKGRKFHYVCLYGLDTKLKRISAAANNPYLINSAKPSPEISPSSSPISSGGSSGGAANVAPIANNDIDHTNMNVAKIIAVRSNDFDANGDSLTITSVNNGTQGTTTTDGATVTYTPNNNFYGSDTFSYEISDGHGGVASANVTIYVNTPFTWVGAGNDTNWSTGANWLGGSTPGASDVAVFSGFCMTNCDPTIASNINVKGILLDITYSGIILQGSGKTITVGADYFKQFGGSFVGSDAAITLSGFELGGGSFKSTSNTLKIGRAFSYPNQASNGFKYSAGSFDANNGTLEINASVQSDGSSNWEAIVFNISSADFEVNNFIIQLSDTLSNGGYAAHATLTGKIAVNGNLNIKGGKLDGGIIEMKGSNINIDCPSGAGGSICAGTGSTVIKFTGNATQTYSTITGGVGPIFKIEKSGGNLSAASGTTDLNISEFELASGTFVAPTGAMSIGNGLSYNASRSSGFKVASGTTFTHNNGTVVFKWSAYTDGSRQAGVVNLAAPLSLYNLNIDVQDLFGNGGLAGAYLTFSGSESISVQNDLRLIAGNIMGGNIVAQKNLSIECASSGGSNCFYGGQTQVIMKGGQNQTYAYQSHAKAPKLKIDNAGFSVSPAIGTTDLKVFAFELAAGSFDAPSGTLDINTTYSTSQSEYNTGGTDSALRAPDGFIVASGTSFNNQANTTLAFTGSYRAINWGTNSISNISLVNIPNNFTIPNLTIAVVDGWKAVTSSGDEANVDFVAGSFNVTNDLTLQKGKIAGSGSIAVQGNVSILCNGGAAAVDCFYGLALPLTLNGTGNQILSIAAGASFYSVYNSHPSYGGLIVDKASGNLTIADNLTLRSNQYFQILSGNVYANGRTITVAAGQCSGNSGALLELQGGSLAPCTFAGGTVTVNP